MFLILKISSGDVCIAVGCRIRNEYHVVKISTVMYIKLKHNYTPNEHVYFVKLMKKQFLGFQKLANYE